MAEDAHSENNANQLANESLPTMPMANTPDEAAAFAAPAGRAPEGARPTSAGDFRKASEKERAGELLELGGGKVVRVRRPSITRMVQAGIIPAQVAASALKMDTGKPMTDKDVLHVFNMKAIVLETAFLEPKLIVGKANYDNGEISFDDLTEDEINDVYQYVQVGLEALEKFREKRRRAVAGSGSEPVPGDQAE